MIRDIKELDKLISNEARDKARRDFEKFYPTGTPVIMCTSSDEEDYLKQVDLAEFE